MNAVVIQGPRLPYHPAVAERFGVDQTAWRVLTDAVFPAANRPESIIMALGYCRARNLDIFKKPVQIVPIWDSKRREMVDTVWPGISELRTTAMRTKNFAGFDDTAYGPMIEETLGEVEVRYPEWAQCTVYRLIAGQRVPFVGPKAFCIRDRFPVYRQHGLMSVAQGLPLAVKTKMSSGSLLGLCMAPRRS